VTSRVSWAASSSRPEPRSAVQVDRTKSLKIQTTVGIRRRHGCRLRRPQNDPGSSIGLSYSVRILTANTGSQCRGDQGTFSAIIAFCGQGDTHAKQSFDVCALANEVDGSHRDRSRVASVKGLFGMCVPLTAKRNYGTERALRRLGIGCQYWLSVFELIAQSDAAAGSFCGVSPCTVPPPYPPGLDLQTFGQIHLHLRLRGSGRELLAAHVDRGSSRSGPPDRRSGIEFPGPRDRPRSACFVVLLLIARRSGQQLALHGAVSGLCAPPTPLIVASAAGRSVQPAMSRACAGSAPNSSRDRI